MRARVLARAILALTVVFGVSVGTEVYAQVTTSSGAVPCYPTTQFTKCDGVNWEQVGVTVDPGVPERGVGIDAGRDRDGTDEGVLPTVPVTDCLQRAAADPACGTRQEGYHSWHRRQFEEPGGVFFSPKHSYDLATTHYRGNGVVYVCAYLQGYYSGDSYGYECGNNDATVNFPGNNRDAMLRSGHHNRSDYGHTIHGYGYY